MINKVFSNFESVFDCKILITWKLLGNEHIKKIHSTEQNTCKIWNKIKTFWELVDFCPSVKNFLFIYIITLIIHKESSPAFDILNNLVNECTFISVFNL